MIGSWIGLHSVRVTAGFIDYFMRLLYEFFMLVLYHSRVQANY